MNRGLLLAIAGGLLVTALFFRGIGGWFGTGEAVFEGSILKVRSAPADEQHTLVLLDVRIQNRSDLAIQVRDVAITLQTGKEESAVGRVVSSVDIKELLSYYPALGQAYNEPLMTGTRVDPHKTADLMLVARLDIPEAELSGKDISVTVTDRSGAKAQLQVKHR